MKNNLNLNDLYELVKELPTKCWVYYVDERELFLCIYYVMISVYNKNKYIGSLRYNGDSWSCDNSKYYPNADDALRNLLRWYIIQETFT